MEVNLEDSIITVTDITEQNELNSQEDVIQISTDSQESRSAETTDFSDIDTLSSGSQNSSEEVQSWYSVGKIWNVSFPQGNRGKKQIEEREEERKRKAKFLESIHNTNVFIELFEWAIWFQTMDPDKALVSSCCGKTWWFDWIIRSLKQSRKWPNWRKFLKYENLRKNSTLRELYEEILKEKEVESKLDNKEKCNEHLKKIQGIWEDCKANVCISWILDTHKGHNVVELLVKEENINDLADDIISNCKGAVQKIK